MRFKTHKSILAAVLVVLLAFSCSGCVYLIVGGVSAVGGYSISQDTIQGESDASFDEVWDAAIHILSIMGRIESESSELGEVVAIVNGARITVHVIQLTSETVRLKIRGRKSLFPSISNAQNVFMKIMNRVNGEL